MTHTKMVYKYKNHRQGTQDAYANVIKVKLGELGELYKWPLSVVGGPFGKLQQIFTNGR